jgi:translation initiation factor 4G
VIPSAKKSPIIIKDPNSGSVKTFDKNPASPARATPSPVKIATPTATPPPRTSSATDHSRTDSKANSTKTDEEKKQELKDAVRQKIQDDEAAQKRKAEEAARKSAEEAKPAEVKSAEVKPVETKPTETKPTETKPAETKPAETKPAETKPVEAKPVEAKPVEAKPVEAKKEDATESARAALEDLSLKEKAAPAEEPKKAPAPTAAPAPAPAPPADEDEIDYDAIEREMAEIEAKERAAEEDYKRKKQAQKEEAERKEREERDQYEINMKKAEQEAEERELAREAARAKGDNTEDEVSRREREDLFASLKKGGFNATEASSPADSGAATPVSSDMGPPAKPASAAAAKKPAGLKLDTPKPTEPPQPSAAMKSLQNAKFLEDLSKITYPSSVNAPDASLNANSPAGRRFHYDRDFLLQFQAAFKDKISIDWDARVRETVGDSDASSRPQSARTPSMGGRNPSHKGLGGFPGASSMGNFGQTTRQSMPAVNSSLGGRNTHAFGSFGRPGMPGMGAPIGSRNNSSNMPMSPRVASSKGGAGSKRGKHGGKREEDTNKAMPLTAGMELKALQQSSTGWKPRSIGASATAGPAPGGEGHMPPDVVQRKVKAALNKMTPEKFDRISSQILEIVSQSKDESDGRTLRQVIQLTFEKATDEAHWAPMYAKFCKSMLESMSAEIKDENIRDRNGNIGKLKIYGYSFNAFKILISLSQ